MQKNATPNKLQQACIKAAGFHPIEWSVVKDMNIHMIIRHRITGEVKVIEKGTKA